MSKVYKGPISLLMMDGTKNYEVLVSSSETLNVVGLTTIVKGEEFTRDYPNSLSPQEMIENFKIQVHNKESESGAHSDPFYPYYVAPSTANADSAHLTELKGRYSNNWVTNTVITPPDSPSNSAKFFARIISVSGLNITIFVEERPEEWVYSCNYLNIKTVHSKLGYSEERAIEELKELILGRLKERESSPQNQKNKKSYYDYDVYTDLLHRVSSYSKVESKDSDKPVPNLKVGESIYVGIKGLYKHMLQKRNFAIVKSILPDNQVELIIAEFTKKLASKVKYSLWKGDLSQIKDHEKVEDYHLGKATLKSYENSAAAFGNKTRLKKLVESKQKLNIAEELNNYTLASGRIIPKVYKVAHEDKFIKVVASDVEITPFNLKGWNLPKQRNLELGCKAIIKDDRKLRSIKREDIVTIIKFMQMQHTLDKPIPKIAKVKTESGEEHLVPYKVLKRL